MKRYKLDTGDQVRYVMAESAKDAWNLASEVLPTQFAGLYVEFSWNEMPEMSLSDESFEYRIERMESKLVCWKLEAIGWTDSCWDNE